MANDKLIKPLNQVDLETDNWVVVIDPCDLPSVCDSDTCATCNLICWRD